MRAVSCVIVTIIASVVTSASSKAQNAVPGGWSSQIRYQGVGTGSFVSGPSYGQLGWNNGFYDTGVVRGRSRQVRGYVPRPQTSNNLGGLADTVRRTTRTRRAR